MAILGIDAAWTPDNPSGVALLDDEGKFVAAAPSSTAFINLLNGVSVDWSRPAKSGGTIVEVLDACSQYLPNDPVSFIAVDMPVSTAPIIGRRECDDMVSRKFGGRGCGTHSPSPDRPGNVSASFSMIMESMGFELAVHRAEPRAKKYLEVYPHTALLRLTRADYRLEYKEAKKSKYWPDASASERRTNLLGVWERIKRAIEDQVGNIVIPISEPISLKPVEDAIDAVVCAWVGHQFQIGNAESLGDLTSAIWTPASNDARETHSPELDLSVGSARDRRTPLFEKEPGSNCPFCNTNRKILAENDHAFAVYDGYPVSAGHALVIPKRHVPEIFDLDEDEYNGCFQLARSVKSGLEVKHSTDAFNIGVNCGTVAGQTILHAHIHIIPRYAGDVDKPAGGIRHVIPHKGSYK